MAADTLEAKAKEKLGRGGSKMQEQAKAQIEKIVLEFIEELEKQEQELMRGYEENNFEDPFIDGELSAIFTIKKDIKRRLAEYTGRMEGLEKARLDSETRRDRTKKNI